MKVVFMGTPDFAVSTLTALVEAGHQVAAVVTQPDKPKGRGKSVLMTPVKEKAIEYGILVYQPERIKKDEEFFRTLTEIGPDAIVVAAFGQILPRRILELPKYGCVNVHASLLPKYRGSAPIQWAVIDGEKETGITTMMMDVGLDTGDMLEKVIVPLDEKETGGSLFDKLSLAGGALIVSTLEKLEAGTAVRVRQPEEGATYAKMLDKSMGEIDWTMDAAAIERLVRGLNPWPSAFTHYQGKTLKIWAADVVEGPSDMVEVSADGADTVPAEMNFKMNSGNCPAADSAAPSGSPACGTVTEVGKDYFLVQTGSGMLAVKELQLEGKKRMDAGAFLRGYPLEAGTLLM